MTDSRYITNILFGHFLISLACFFAFFTISKPACGRTSQLTLTEQEQAWLKDHPEVTMGYTEDYEPNVIKDENGNLSGFMIDIYNEIESLTGLKVNIVLDKWPVAIKKYKDRVTDGLLVVAKKRAKESGSLYTTTISTTAPTIFARSDAPFEINSEKDLIGKRISVLKNTFVVEKALKQYQNQIEIVETDSALEMMKFVLEGKVDAAFGLSFHNFLIGKYFLSGIEPVYYASSLETKGVTAIRPDWPELVSIINKCLAEIGEGKLNQIHNKWLLPYPQTKVTLSESEKAWLAQKQTARVRIPDYPPFTFLDKDGKPTGMAIDYMKLISERTGVEFEYYASDKPFPQALDGLINHQGPDIMPLIVKTPDREKSIIFTKEYINSPFVIYTRADNKQIIAHIDDLKDKKIAILRGAILHAMMQRDYPDFSLMLYDNDIAAIEAVSSGEADAYVGNMILVSYLILNRGPYNLKIAAPSPFENLRFSIGIRNDRPELASIIDKGITSITPEEQTEIRNRYIAVHYSHSDPAKIIRWVLITMSVSLGIILFFFFWNRTLKMQVHKRTSALRESEEKYRVLFESFPLGITISDSTGKIIETNAIAETLLKVPKTEQKHRAIDGPEGRIVRPDGAPLPPEDFASTVALTEKRKVENAEMGLVKPDGAVTWLNVTAAPIPLENYGVAITYGDITDRKKAEEKLKQYSDHLEELVKERTQELERTQKELLLKERLAVLGNIAGSLAHEIRNPLAAVDSTVYLLKMKLKNEDEKIQQLFGRIGSNVNKAACIIESLLNLSRMEKPRTKKHNLSDLISRIAASVDIPPSVEVITNCPEYPVFIDVDSEQFRMAMTNALNNAVQAMNSEGKIIISMRDSETGYIILSVADTGPGIPLENLGKIFEPLFSTKTHGIGFGLSLTKMIIENHGGSVSAEAESEGGATIIFNLPT